MFEKADINFTSRRFIAGLMSVVLIGIGIAAMFGLQDKILHHDLRGGSTVRVVFNQELDSDPDKGRELLKAALEEANATMPDGETAEFTVSKLTSENFPNRVFKIDSNIPSNDGKPGENAHEELDQLISRVFEGKLELLNVKVGASNTDGQSSPAESDTGLNQLNHPSMISMLSLSRPNVLLTSTATQETEQEEQTELELDLGTKTQDDPATDADNRETDTQGEEESAESAGSGTAQEAGDFISPNQGESPNTGMKLPEISTELDFKFPVSGKELLALVQAAAAVEENDFELTEDQITMTSPDADEETPIESVLSSDWTVTLSLNNSSDADKIFDQFSGSYNSTPYFPTISSVGGQIAGDTQIQAMVAIIASLLGIIAYVWIRFQNVAFGLAAVVALIHDVLIVLGAIAVSHYVAGALGFLLIDEFKISLPIVAALLTIIGYSLNDTIVVFDRIREVRGKRA